MSRLIDIVLGTFFFLIFSPMFLIISVLIKIDSKGPIFFISDRVGQYNQIFKMIKFRTMFMDTELVESSMLNNPNSKITNLGKFLRKFSLDEIPQFLCVIYGKMSIVGPRPALPSQINLINKRKTLGIEKIKPGITGYAQIKGRDFLTDDEKINLELDYLKKKSIYLDLFIIIKTFKVVFKKRSFTLIL